MDERSTLSTRRLGSKLTTVRQVGEEGQGLGREQSLRYRRKEEPSSHYWMKGFQQAEGLYATTKGPRYR